MRLDGLLPLFLAAAVPIVLEGCSSNEADAGASGSSDLSSESCDSVKDCRENKSLGRTCTDEVPENCNVECVFADGADKGTCQKPSAPPADASAAKAESCGSVLDCAANIAQNKAHRGSCTDEVPENCVDDCDLDLGVCKKNP